MVRPAWMYKQSGVIPFRMEDKQIKILLISTKSGKKWGIPKGIIERKLKSAESAAKEAFEEAGVKGILLKPAIGKYKISKWEGICRVKVFLLSVKELCNSWPEESYRKRVWISLDQAEKYITRKKLLEIIGLIPDFIKSYEDCF